MKDTLKRLTCMLLALIMVAGMFPVSVFAETGNPISVDAGSTVSNVIGPIGVPEVSQEPAQVPVEEVVEEPAEVVPEVPVFDASQPIRYRVEHSKPFSVLAVLTDAGVPVNTVTGVTGDMAGKVAANASGSDWLLTTYNYFDSLELSVTAKNSPDGEDAVYTVVLSNRDPAKPLPRPAVTLTETVDGTVITVDAPEGALPEGVRLRVAKADPYKALVKALVECGYTENKADFLAGVMIERGMDLTPYIQGFSIGFYLPDNPSVEVEPDGAVNVTFSDMALTASEEIGVLHVTDESVEVIADAEGSGSEVTFSAPSFSEYYSFDIQALAVKAAEVNDSETQRIHDAIVAHANTLYGGTTVTPQISASVTGGPSGPVYAGTLLDYTIHYDFIAPPTWSEGYDKPLDLFDEFTNNEIVISLPAGLILESVPSYQVIVSPEGEDDNPDVAHTYTIKLPNQPAKDASYNFECSVYVCNNGTDKSLSTYNLTNMVSFTSTFTVLDKQDLDNYVEILPPYTQTVTVTPDPVITTTPDVWGVEKSIPAKNGMVISDDESKVTVKWVVDVGLLDDNGVIKSASSYNRPGRDALESLTLTEIFNTDPYTTVFSKDNSVVNPKDGSMTIAKVTDVSTLETGTAVPITNGGSIPLTGDLALNTEAAVDSTGDGTLNVVVPTWTKYVVTAEYEITSDMIADFSLNQKYSLLSKNQVKASAVLADINDPQTDEDDANQSVELPVTDPATVLFAKKLQTYSGTTRDYVPDTDYGPITFKLTSSTPFTVYKINAAGNYEPIVGMDNVTTASPLEAGITYYLAPDIAYTAEEILTPEQSGNMVWKETSNGEKTPAENEAWKPVITNRETKGSVAISKLDDHGDAVKDAEFTLTNSATGAVIGPKTTSAAGTCTFDKIPYGTYILDESTVPAGYVKGKITINGTEYELPATIKVGEEEGAIQNISVNAQNKKTKATVMLTKYVGVAEENITTTAGTTYGGTFVLQRSIDQQTWTPVTEQLGSTPENPKSVPTTIQDANGHITAEVAAFDEDGNPYYYRFVETIPSGYYDPATGSTATSTSDAKTLLDASGKASVPAVEFPMYNRRGVNVSVNKNFYDVQANGTTSANSDKTTTVSLYSYAGNTLPAAASGLTLVGEPNKTVSQNTPARWNNLPVYGPNGKIHYLIKETEVSGYSLDGTQTGNIVTLSDGSRYVEVPMTSATSASFSKRLYNFQQLIPVQVWKRNYYTNAPLEGASVTIYEDEACTVIAKDTEGHNLENVPVPASGSPNYLLVYLTPGKIYYVKETVEPDEYDLHSYNPTNTAKTLGVINLTASSYVQTYANRRNEKNPTATVYNAPDPAILINKLDSTTHETSDTLKTAVFTVYTKDSSGAFVPLKDADNNNITITATGTASSVRLKPDTYYFAETTVPTGYVNPNTDYEQYSGVPGYVHDDTTGLTFFEVQVQDMVKDGTKDNVYTFNFENIPNTGSLKVTKYIDGVKATVLGFPITVSATYTNEAGQEVTVSKTVNTGRDGTASFTGSNALPVYDGSGTLIEYTIIENLTDGQKEIYYKVSDSPNTKLVVGQTITTVDGKPDGAELRVDNATLVSLDVHKVFEHGWYHTSMLVPGAGIGLYVLNEETHKWEYVKTVNTDSTGKALFDKLERDKSYAVVELSSPSDWMIPYQNGTFKPFPNGTDDIPEGELGNYNAWTVSASDLTPEKVSNDSYHFADLVNKNHWVQFHITKYKDPVNNRDLTYNEFLEALSNGTIGDKNKLDNAVFKLYRMIVDDDTETVSASDPGWELLRSYSSGTLYDAEGNRLPGEFMTDIDMNINDNYVYMLVEDNVGPNPGTRINPNFKVTFWHASTHPITCTGANITLAYTIDEINYEKILNSSYDGPGEGKIYIASFRIAKWQDSFDENGLPKKEYQPLRNAKFTVTLADGTVIAQLTSGKLNGDILQYALDQSGAYRLTNILVNTDGTAGTGTLVNYEENDPEAEHTLEIPVTFDIWQSEGYIVYGVPVTLTEIDAPSGYSYYGEGIPTYLCFVDFEPSATVGSYWTFSDAYFIKNTAESIPLVEDQGNRRTWYVTGTFDGDNYALGSDQIRIVDYPMDNTMVTVHKLGYKPTQATKDKTSAELYEHFDTVSLPGVTMALDRKTDEGVWQTWNAAEDTWGTGEGGYTFTTVDNGIFKFPHGLPMGTYRIYETSLGANAAQYEMAYPSKTQAREFFVGGAGKTIYLANPEKLNIRITKQDMNGGGLKDTLFTLTPKPSGTAITGTTGSDGTVTIENIPTGTYVLTENKAGYSSAYLAMYLKSVNAALEALATTGVKIGYEYQVSGSDDKDVVVHEIVPTEILSNNELTLTVKNPKLTQVTVKKTDSADPAKPVTGAQFIGYYKQFDSLDGTMDFTNVSLTTREELTTAGFTRQSSALDGTTAGSDGSYTKTGLYPGIYAFIESSAPSGYDALKTTDGKEVIYFAVLKGDLSVTVNGLPAKTATWDGDVTTLFTDNEDVTVTAKNYQKTKLYAKKSVEAGELDASSLEWSVTLNLYEDANKTIKAGTVTITNATNQNVNDGKGVTFKTSSGGDALFSQGKTYYLEEADMDPDTFFVIDTVLVDGTAVPAGQGGLYDFVVDSLQGYTITVTNKWLRGSVSFTKYDEDSIESGKYTALPGAEFEVRIFNAEKNEWEKLEGSEVTEILNNGAATGSYQADIPLISAEKTKYRIYETKAPNPYLTDKTKYIEVELSFEDNVKELANSRTPGEYITNSQGSNITITKYNNLKSASDHLDEVEANDATFTIYHMAVGENTWKALEPIKTDENGQVIYLATPGDGYAVAETAFDHTKFVELDGVYDANGNLLTPETITVDGVEVEAYVLGTVNSAISLYAYNKPVIKPKIVKVDAGDYPAGILATMKFSVYEVNAGFEATDASVAALVASEQNPVFSGETEGNKTITVDTRTGTYLEWTSDDPAECWDPSKAYVLVETSVSAANGTYNTMNKDDKRVVWFLKIDPVADPDPANPPMFVLYNIYSEAEVQLKKAVTPSSVDSLLTGPQEVLYTLTPSFVESKTANQPLTTFVLKDNGVTFAPVATTGPQPSYSITKVTVGGASHNVSNLDYEIGETAPIVARVVFDGDEDNAVMVNDFSSQEQATVSAPAGTQTFTIEYYSPAVRTATGWSADGGVEGKPTGYSLGQDFTVSPSTFNVTINKLEDGTAAEPVTEITSFTNTADVEITYLKWAANGDSTALELVRSSADASVPVDVKSVTLPRVKVTKTSTPAQAIQLGGTIDYKLTIENLGTPAVDFVNPVLLDMLPTGVTYTGEYSCSQGTAGETFEVKDYRKTGNPTRTITTASGQVKDGDAETAVIFELEGTLKPGSKVTVTFKAQVNDAAILYGKTMENYTFLSSSKHSYHIAGVNPYGYSFHNDVGQFPPTLPTAAANLDDGAAVREGGLHTVLGDYADADKKEYVWVTSQKDLTVNAYASITLRKAVWGDRDEGYDDTDTFLGTATRTNSTPGKETNGWVKWRLAVTNGEVKNSKWIAIGDAIPKIGDPRETKWNVVFDQFLTVKISGADVAANKYFVYFYTGAPSGALAEVQTQLDKCIDWADGSTEPAWPVRTSLPSGWHKAADVTDKASITGFIIVFDSDIELPAGDSLEVSYHTLVEDIPSEPASSEEFFASVAFQNANNTFSYNAITNNRVLNSNTVSVTLMDKPVAVEGDLWIDEDWDATQEAQNRRDYTQYDIINQLIAATKFGIFDNRDSSKEWSYNDVGAGLDHGWGESIKHFRFEGLGAATLKDGITDPYNGGEDLVTRNLKTTDPFNYILNAAVNNSSLLDIFQITDRGAGYYMSDDPDALTATSANVLDDNFFGDPGSYNTKPFYLRYSTVVDQSKDIGFRMTRSLELTKVALDDETITIPGAKFSVYGPYGDTTRAKGYTPAQAHTPASGNPLTFSGTTGNYALDPSGSITELETDENGKIVITGLNWWKEYDIKEIAAGDGYQIAGATAEPDSRIIPTDKEDVFTLLVPTTDRTDPIDKVTVKNPRTVEVKLNVEKLLKTYSLKKFTFKFDLKLTEEGLTEEQKALNAELLGKDPIETLELTIPAKTTNTTGESRVYGTFGAGEEKIKLYGAGTYTFTITEQNKTNGEAEDETPAISYDTVPKEVIVVVTWHEKEGNKPAGLYVDSITYTNSDTHDSQTYELIENTFDAEGEWTPYIKKVLHGRPLEDDEFTFTVTDTTVSTKPVLIATGIAKADGTVELTYVDASGAALNPQPTGVHYTLADVGTHTYVIHEVEAENPKPDSDNNGIPDDGISQHAPDKTVTVTVEEDPDHPKELKVTESPKSTQENPHVMPNTYEAKGKWTPKALKVLVGRELKKDEFTFILEKGTKQEDDSITWGTVETVGNLSDGTVPFTTVFNYTQDTVGTYYYRIREDVEHLPPLVEPVPGTPTEYNITVKVSTVKGSDKLKVVVDPDDTVPFEFKNEYHHEPISHTIPVEKTISENIPPQLETFKFELKLTSDNAANVKTKDGSGQYVNYADQEVELILGTDDSTDPPTVYLNKSTNFEELWFLNAGTYNFTVTEKVPDPQTPGYTYSTDIYTVTVTVTKDPVSGKLSKTVSMVVNDTTEATKIVFDNKYIPTPAEDRLAVKKLIKKTPPADLDATFTFTLAPVGSAPMTHLVNGVSTPLTVDQKQVTITAAEAATGTIKYFGYISFTKVGTYQYTITETDASTTYPWFGFNTSSVTATVKVIDDPDNAGKLKVESIKYGDVVTTAAEITNTYADGEWTPYIKKELTGRPLEDDEFTFTVTDTTDTTKPVVIATGIAKANGTVELTYVDASGAALDPQPTGVHYTLADVGTHTYVIHEVEADNPANDGDAEGTPGHGIPDDGISQHAPDKTVTVKVEKDSANPTELKVTESPKSTQDNPHVMPNTYEAEGSWTPKALKVLEGRTIKAGDFTFILEKGTMENGVISYSTVKTATNDADGKVDFASTFTYTQDDVGTHYYRIREDLDKLPPLVTLKSPASGEYEITVTVSTVKGSDKLKVVVNPDDTAPYEFENEYHHEPIPYTVPVEKIISDNIPPQLETFKFEMSLTSKNGQDVSLDKEGTKTLVDNSIPVIELTLGTDNSTDPPTVYLNKSTNFEELWFLNPGTYTFEVTETIPSAKTPGFTYSTTVYVVTVTVTKDADSGVLSKSVSTVIKDTTEETAIVFDNIYHTEPVKEKLKAQKKLTGEPLYDAENTFFDFILTEEKGKCKPQNGYVMPAVDPETGTIHKKVKGTDVEAGNEDAIAKFDEITFNYAGEYYFLIHENAGVSPKVFYDPSIWEVKVVIKDSVDNGVAKLVVESVEYTSLKDGSTDPDHAVFTNDYNPDDTYFLPKVTKVLEGIDYEGRVQETFHFELKVKTNPKDGATMPPALQRLVDITDQGYGYFGQIEFTKKGTYEFTIEELIPDPGTGGYTYDVKPGTTDHWTDPWTLEVVITDNAKGELFVESYRYYRETTVGTHEETTEGAAIISQPHAGDGAKITNKYKPTPTDYTPPIEKTIKMEFGPTVESKTYYFEMKAVSGTANGQYYVKDGNNAPIVNGETVLTQSIEVAAGVTTAQSSFDKIYYERQGTYKYQIKETVPVGEDPEEGIIYSTSIWNLEISVKNNNGTLEKESVVYTLVSTSETGSGVTFENTYKPTPTVFTPKGTKTIEAEFGPTVASKIFKFDLTLTSAEREDEKPDGTKETVDVTDGTDIQAETKTIEVAAGETTKEIIFSKITFSKAGTYTYKIVEQVSKEEGITDDTAERTLEIVVTDKDGALFIESYKYSDGEEKSTTADGDVLDGTEAEIGADVTNIYKPEPTKYQPEVDKTMTVFYGPTVAEKVFKFDLKLTSAEREDIKPDGTKEKVDVSDAASLAADTVEVKIPAGKDSNPAKFQEITFTKAGTYTFEIKEQPSGEEGITDDTSVWTLVVVITDTDGKLEVTSTKYTSDDTTVPASDSTATFVNPYKPEPTEYAPQVIKNIDLVTGAPTSLDKTFKFNLEFITATAMDGFTDVSDGQLDAAESAGGKQFVSDSVVITVPAGEVTVDPASFMTIHFTKAGIYSYRITEEELLPPELGMAYDGSVWILKVVVTDKDGKLEVTGTSYTNDPSVTEISNTNAIFVNPYRTGSLKVEKRVSGNGASTMTKFTFKVTLFTENPFTGIREPLAGEYPVEIYDSKGNLIETATVVNGTVTFKLRHGQYAIIKNIPIGVKWEVEEEKYTGYASSAETPNKGTIGLLESVSKWKNHRSTVPPVPRTGYGDGTTVKIGLFSSLGVFLASTIGSILQSKSTKKKKRGGGSHAAN